MITLIFKINKTHWSETIDHVSVSVPQIIKDALDNRYTYIAVRRWSASK